MDLFAKMATYVRVIESGSLTAAAKQLRLSGPAVSRQIAALEREVGTSLVARTTRKLSVTAAGQRYYERCLRILREVDDAQAIGRAGVEGLLRVSVPVTFGLASVMPHLRTFAAKHPALRLDVRVEDRVIDLVLEGVDVALRVAVTPPPSTEIVAHRLASWPRIMVASPGYLRRRGAPKSPAALANHDALSHALEASAGVWVLTNGSSVQVRLSARYASNTGYVLRELACDGLGIALLPHWLVADDLAHKRLRRVLPAWESEPVAVHALYRTLHRNEQRVRLLVDHLRAAYAVA